MSIQKLLLIPIVLLFAVAAARAAPFVHPPELPSPTVGPIWQGAFPYQRNILVDFTTDPATWPDDPTSVVIGGRKDLIDGVSSHLQGTDDPVLYPSDWFEWEGPLVWHDQDPTGSSMRQGIVGINDPTGTESLLLTWHIDNWDRPSQEKHFYVEAEYYSTGNGGQDLLTSSLGDVVVLQQHNEVLSDGWILWRSWAVLRPNPEWEEMTNSVDFLQQGPGDNQLYVDYFHIATECTIPIPAALALAPAAGLVLCRRGRRT